MDNKQDIPPTIDPDRINILCMILDEEERNKAIWEYVHEIKIPYVKILYHVYRRNWFMQKELLLSEGMCEDDIKNLIENKYIS